jgi:hypothetical protein
MAASTPLPLPVLSGQLVELLRGVGSDEAVFVPKAFFIAAGGVMALVMHGFPRRLQVRVRARVAALSLADFSLQDIKRRMREESHLAPENSGSLWPKISLGALADGAQLSESEFEDLGRLCHEHNEKLARLEWVVRPQACSVVVFECRSLERIIFRGDVPFRAGEQRERPQPSRAEALALVDKADAERVDSVLSECKLGTYLSQVNVPANHEAHYRTPHYETTAVLFVGVLHALVASFRARVDAMSKGKYRWFADSALHITLRTLTKPAK